MAEPGNLTKATSAQTGFGLVGQRCVQWDEPTTPPPAQLPEIERAPIPTGSGPARCPALQTVYVWNPGGLSSGSGSGGCYAVTRAVNGSSACGSIARVPDSYCGQ